MQQRAIGLIDEGLDKLGKTSLELLDLSKKNMPHKLVKSPVGTLIL